jgi:hypothetical protein
MDVNNDNGWDRYKRVVCAGLADNKRAIETLAEEVHASSLRTEELLRSSLAQLGNLEGRISEFRGTLGHLEGRMSEFRSTSAIWGALGGIIVLAVALVLGCS